ncbi:MAG: HEPN domain-containing protein [Candidatus Jacksonbacteria bacterium]|nr:HEPN domain-containing protein [Candidatus Jacksonbacteria bacterium]
MTSAEIKKVVTYWQKTAAHDYETMVGLFRIKRYSDCLFFGHIVLEKILKALVVLEIKKHAEYTHDLIKLAHEAHLPITTFESKMLDTINGFNIRTRYPEEKLEFYKLCTKSYTTKYLVFIKAFYLTICQILKQNKQSEK